MLFRSEDFDVQGLEFKKRKVVEEPSQSLRASGRIKKKGLQSEAGGSGASKLTPYSNKKGRAQKGKNLGPSEVEEEPAENTADMSTKEWRLLRSKNPYRFKTRTYEGTNRLFWTKTQYAMWADFYNEPS